MEIEDEAKNIIDSMNSFNGKRLYWVWASSLINKTLSLIPSDFSNVHNALTIMDNLSFYTGIISWTLYYARFSLHLTLLLKNTIEGPWLTKEDKALYYWNLSVYDRFIIQWNDAKFNILNDFIWATGNLICYFWFIGPGLFGHLGSVLTIALLLFDVGVSMCIYLDRKEKNHYSTEWIYEEYKLYNDIGYAIGLFIAFSLMTVPFFSIAAPFPFALSLVGTVLCFGLSILHDAISGIIDLYKDESLNKEMHLVYSIFLSLITPMVILSSLVCLPIPNAIIALSAYAALSVVSDFVIDDVCQKESSNYKLSFFSKNKESKCELAKRPIELIGLNRS